MKKLLHNEILTERLTPEEAMKTDRFPVSLIVHNVRSLYNVGSIFRTCDSALISELVLCGFTPYPPRKEIEKTALGAVDSVPWRYEKDIFKAIHSFKELGIRVFALELTDKKRTYDSLTKEDFPLCIIAGNELTGLDNDILNVCDDAIEIPMYGVKHSLNVSVSVGVALFEAVRKWNSFYNI
ncbi:TrmH family RNA methyltransferase [Bacteroidota bacterium]